MEKYYCENKRIGWYCPHAEWCAEYAKINFPETVDSPELYPPPCETALYTLWRLTTGHGICMDCGKDVYACDEYFMLNNSLWRKINPDESGDLCLHCTERRLQRKLRKDDFVEAPVNEDFFKKC